MSTETLAPTVWEDGASGPLTLGRHRPRRIYLAGPMSGYVEFNFPAFRKAAADLRSRGFDVWSPNERDEAEGFNAATDEAMPIAHYMKHDLPAVCDAEAVICLPGWEDSTGATLETVTAVRVGIPVYAYGGKIERISDDEVLVAFMAKALSGGGVSVEVEIVPDPPVETTTVPYYPACFGCGGPIEAPRQRLGSIRCAGCGSNEAGLYTCEPACSESCEACVEDTSESVCREADRLVSVDRQDVYGHPADDFGRTAEFWTTRFRHKLRDGEVFTAEDVPAAMRLVKESRLVNSPRHRDSLVDVCGYAKTQELVWERLDEQEAA